MAKSNKQITTSKSPQATDGFLAHTQLRPTCQALKNGPSSNSNLRLDSWIRQVCLGLLQTPVPSTHCLIACRHKSWLHPPSPPQTMELSKVGCNLPSVLMAVDKANYIKVENTTKKPNTTARLLTYFRAKRWTEL